MIPFLKLPATSQADCITIKEVLRNDIWRLLLSTAVLLGVFYGAGMLIADVANNKYPSSLLYATSLWLYASTKANRTAWFLCTGDGNKAR